MLLVHLHLRPRPCGPQLSLDVLHAVQQALTTDSRIAHVSLHTHDQLDPVLGAFLQLSAAEAEATVRAVWRDVAATHPCLHSCVLQECRVTTH